MMDLIISQSEDCDYKMRNTNLSSQLCEFVLMEANSPIITEDVNNLNNWKLTSKESTKKRTPYIDYEKMLYFVCNLCPYLCIQDSKISEHIDNDHKDNKTSSKLLQLKCPACPNIFYRNTSLKSHLVHDHKVDSSDLRQIMQAVIYYAKKSCNSVVKPQPTVYDTNYKNEIDMSLIEKLMNGEKLVNNEHSYSKEPEIINSNVCENTIGQVHVIKDLRLKDVEIVQKIEVKSLRLMNLPMINISQSSVQEIATPPTTIQKSPDTFTKFLEQKLLLKCSVLHCKVCMMDVEKLDYHTNCHLENTFKCLECNEIFAFWKPLTAHLWRLHKIDMELYACDKCDYKSPSLGKLNNSHKLIHGDVRAFECVICNKKFKNTKQLRNHKAVHRNKAKRINHACDICVRVFADNRQVKVHKDVVHKKIKPFLCSYCGYKAASKSTLKMHIRQHTGEKPFSCSVCNYSTADHNSLRRHKLRHTGQRPYKCSHCDYACIQATTYKEHIRTKHPGVEKDIVFTCQDCQFRSVNKEIYLSHIFTAHQRKS